MNLCVDVGNTRVELALFENNKLFKKFFSLTPTKHNFTSIEELLKSLKSDSLNIENIIYSSVVPTIDDKLIELIKGTFAGKFLKFDVSKISLGSLKMHIDDPKEVGSDLIADAVGAVINYGAPTLIVDLGTASKFIYVDESIAFSSVNIVPGLSLSIKALSGNTDLLPLIDLKTPTTVVAKNTLDCINSGVVFAHVDMIDGMIRRYANEMRKQIKVILTGGNAKMIKPLLREECILDEDLNAYGLNELINLNK